MKVRLHTESVPLGTNEAAGLTRCASVDIDRLQAVTVFVVGSESPVAAGFSLAKSVQTELALTETVANTRH
jgi:hypothetical protein